MDSSTLGIAAVMLVTLETVRWVYISHRFNCMAIEIEKVAMELEELTERVELASDDD